MRELETIIFLEAETFATRNLERNGVQGDFG